MLEKGITDCSSNNLRSGKICKEYNDNGNEEIANKEVTEKHEC